MKMKVANNHGAEDWADMGRAACAWGRVPTTTGVAPDMVILGDLYEPDYGFCVGPNHSSEGAINRTRSSNVFNTLQSTFSSK